MGEVLGPSVDIVEGAIEQVDSASVRMNVFRVTDLRGQVSTWTGEQVQLPREGIAGFRERQMSKSRSWIFAGAVIGLVVFTAIAMGLIQAIPAPVRRVHRILLSGGERREPSRHPSFALITESLTHALCSYSLRRSGRARFGRVH
jgi:hypothetical protein